MPEPIDAPELANRLARAIASDIALYNEEKIVKGIKEDSLFEELADEVQEGRKLYESRVAKDLFSQSNFYNQALVDLVFKVKGEQVPSKIW